MANHGYSYVPEKGFIGFQRELSSGEWAEVSSKKYDTTDQTAGAGLVNAPQPVVWKLRATWAITALREALGRSAVSIEALDARWDSSQRKLHFALGSALEDDDTEKREAAGRLRGALLVGNGTGQTKLSYDEEVDFGRQQVAITARGQLAADVAAVGLGALLKQIDDATESLARGIGRGPGNKRVGARSLRIREALMECAVAFNGIHDDIAWFLERTEPGEARRRLERMNAPFEALLERYPSPRGAQAAPVMEEEAADPGAGEATGAEPGAPSEPS